MVIEAIEVQIILGVLITSTISGILGMGGGMILMALFGAILPVKAAMILHGVTQLSSNGFRGYIHRENIKWKFAIPYLLGAIILFTIFKFLNVVPNKGMIYLLLGSFPFLAFLPRVSKFFSIDKRFRPLLSGAAVTCAQLLAGASGAVLDVFFLNSSMNRYEIIATKAMTQVMGHGMKLLYYFSIIEVSKDLVSLNYYIYPAVVATSFIGTCIGKRILSRLSESSFRRLSKGIIFTLATGLLVKGVEYL